MNVKSNGSGYLYNDTSIKEILAFYGSTEFKISDKYFLFSKEIEFSKIFCHSMICKI